MKSLTKYKNIKESKGVFVAAIIILLGIFGMVSMLNALNSRVEQNQSRVLENTISAVDSSMSYLINQAEKEMKLFFEADRVKEEMASWNRGAVTGDSRITALEEEHMIQIMKASLPYDNPLIEDMYIADREGELVISSGSKDYETGEKIKDNVYTCTDGDGGFFYEVKVPLENGYTGRGVIDVEGLYQRFCMRDDVTDKNLMMLDKSTGILFYDTEEGPRRCTEKNYRNRANIVKEEAKALFDAQRTNRVVELSQKREVDGQDVAIRSVAVPTENISNGYVAISLSFDYSPAANMVSDAIITSFICFTIIMIGLIILIRILAMRSRENWELDKEIESLKEKNRQAEALMEKNKEIAHHQRLETIGTLTSSIAHEFNNLLTPIMGYSMMIIEKLPDDSDMYDDALEIYTASAKARDIISRLSELSRKNTEAVFKEIKPDVLMDKVIRIARPGVPNNVDVSYTLNAPQARIKGNDQQLTQLLLNIVINALYAAGEVGGKVTISTEELEDEILFLIEDTGKGIPEEHMEQLFDPFFTTKEVGKGTGLGLAIARQAAEDHKGRIEIKPTPGEGARFKIFIPKMKGKEDER